MGEISRDQASTPHVFSFKSQGDTAGLLSTSPGTFSGPWLLWNSSHKAHFGRYVTKPSRICILLTLFIQMGHCTSHGLRRFSSHIHVWLRLYNFLRPHLSCSLQDVLNPPGRIGKAVSIYHPNMMTQSQSVV